MGTAVVQARNWRVATFASLCLVLLSPRWDDLSRRAAEGRTSHRPNRQDGLSRLRRSIGQSAREYRPSDAVLKYHLRRFIDDTRTVSSDVAIMRRNWIDAYSLITEAAGNQRNSVAQQSDPFKRMQTERISVSVVAVVQLSKGTWQADWKETSWDKGGTELGSTMWRGTFRVVLRPPEDEEQLVSNPMGLLVDEFHWSKVQG